MINKLLTTLMLFFVLFAVSAYDFTLEITNDTGYDVFFVRVSSSNSEYWGDDHLGDDVLFNGDTVTVRLSSDERTFDIQLEDEDGDTYTLYNQQLKPGKINSMEITIADLDLDDEGVMAGSGTGAEYDVEIVNDTGYTIYFLYISPETSDNWEEDVLGDDVLSDGESVIYTLSGYATDVFDIHAEDEDGDTITLYGQTLDAYDTTVIELTAYDYDE